MFVMKNNAQHSYIIYLVTRKTDYKKDNFHRVSYTLSGLK